MTEYRGTGAELICQVLASVGADTLFGVPGDTGVALYDALSRAPGIRHVLTNDERGAVFAADAYARRAHRVGVVEVSSGGGSTFCIGGLGEAFAASVPLVVVSSDIHRGSRGSGALTETDQVALFSGVTKAQYPVESAAELPQTLVGAFATAAAGRPGPVAVIVPEDVLDEQAKATVDAPQASSAASPTSGAAVSRAAAAIDAAERPVVVAGGGVHLADAYEAVLSLAEKAGMPVATTIHGKGAIAETHPLSLGVLGANGGRPYATTAVAEADVALLVGTRANATDTDGFRAPDRVRATVAYIDVLPRGPAGHNYPNGIALRGDAGQVLAELLAAVTPAAERYARASALAAEARDDWVATNDKRPSLSGVLDPWQVIERVQGVVPPDVTVVGDPGTPTPYLSAMWRSTVPGRRVIMPRGHGPMGYAVPAALGAAHAVTGQPVVAFTTDGSMLMAAGALESAARAGLPIVYVQFSNGSLGWIKALQALYGGGRFFGTQLSRFDPVTVAQGFGVPAKRAVTLDQVSDFVREALASSGPAFLDVPSPDEHECLPPVSSWERAVSGAESTRPVY